jgi:hypothetical protein
MPITLNPTENVFVVPTADNLPDELSRFVIYHLLYDPGDGEGLYYSPDEINLVKIHQPGGGGGGPAAFNYNWSTNTSTSAPASGTLKVNNATYSSATQLRIHETDADTNDLNQVFDRELVNNIRGYLSTSGVGVRLRVVSQADPTKFLDITLDVPSDVGAYRTSTISYVDSNGTFADAEAVTVHFLGPYISALSRDGSLLMGVATSAGLSDEYGWVENKRVRLGISSRPRVAFYDGTNDDVLMGYIEGSISGSTYNLNIRQGGTTGNSGTLKMEMMSTSSVMELSFGGERRARIFRNSWEFGWTSSFAGVSLFIKEQTTAQTDQTAMGQLWVKDDTPNVLYFTDDAGTDWNLLDVGGTAQIITAGWRTSSGGSGGSLTIEANAPLFYEEQAADDAPSAGQGQVWLRNDTPNTLMFTDDALNDYEIAGNLSAPTKLWVGTDATRPAAGTAGRVFFNSDDGNLNIDNGTNWILPDGTTT